MNDHEYDRDLLRLDRFPKTAKYDVEWILENEMGPNALWLLEDLLERMPVPGRPRILDMGCGTALTSVFLAKELGARYLGFVSLVLEKLPREPSPFGHSIDIRL